MQQSDGPRVFQELKMKHNYLLGVYEKALPNSLSLDENLYIAKNYGFDFIEVCLDENEARMQRIYWNDKRIERLLKISDHLEMSFETVSLSYIRKMPLGILDDSINTKALEIIDQALQFTRKIGARILLINGYDVYNEPSSQETLQRFVTNLKQVATLGKKHGIIIGLENAEMEMADSITKVKRFIDKINSPFLKIYADIGNSTNAYDGKINNILEDIKTGNNDIVAVHLKDNRPNEFRHVLFGEGRVDFDACLEVLKGYSVDTYVAELFESQNWEENLTYTKQFLENKLNK